MSKKLIQAAAGAAGGAVYVDDVFSTHLYTGNGNYSPKTGTNTISNGIDLSGEGGLVWARARDTATTIRNMLFDTERGVSKPLYSERSDGQGTYSGYGVTSFNSDGFTLEGNLFGENYNTAPCVSWSFRKQAGFFDVVTYTGNSTSGRGIAHNLGSTPGFVIVKCTSDAEFWRCFHRTFSASNDVSLNSTAAVAANGHFPTVPDADNFYVGAGNQVNGTGKTYVAYLFAHDDQSFGDNSDESIIKCGSYTGDGGAGTTEVNLGFEPQWILVKATSAADNWFIIDNMRGWATESNTSNDAYLLPNASNAESTGGFLDITATGFKTTLFSNVNVSGRTYAYVAIRRPMKTPESGTDVFASSYNQEVASATSGFYSGFPVDLAIKRIITASQPNYIFDRLRGARSLRTDNTSTEGGFGAAEFDHQEGFYYDDDSSNTNDISWMFKRGTGFLDIVAYTGTGGTGTQSHNLGVTPELMIFKRRTDAVAWLVYSAPTTASKFLELNDTAAAQTDANFLNGAPTSTLINTGSNTNQSTKGYIAYLFATLDGVSKVGTYTGTGSDINVDCGFSAGARFVLIKRTDSSSNWYLFDSIEQGIVAGNDPYIQINNTNAQTTGQDSIDPLSSGFTVTAAADVNQSGGSYIFLAIA